MDVQRDYGDSLNWLVNGGLFDHVTSEQRPDGEEGARLVKIWGRGWVGELYFRLDGVFPGGRCISGWAAYFPQRYAWSIRGPGMKVTRRRQWLMRATSGCQSQVLSPGHWRTLGAQAWHGRIRVVKNSFLLLCGGVPGNSGHPEINEWTSDR